ncbi:hypothetical protein N7509_001791 [Penicillium cosmopolitanum]|uniref:Uncharacterized protein n=1 Tax=Penicillium cosmopolitanum TaxID=1131564 RepID=A0A9X0BCQ2_9EURO|nr:uncharacterized protein N7509_001791 [Penicillium cosmopolitanum]KAJ5407908.1 hypothetical protein N7509_001791 [Penicillium cosmopolitanum]
MSDSKYNHNEFVKARLILYKNLEDLSTALQIPYSDRQSIAKSLIDCTEELDTMDERAAKAQATEGADVPSCLKKRCRLIKEVMNALSAAVAETDRMLSRAVLMTAYLSSQVGRLTLNAHDDRVDKTARHCDEGTVCLELNWVRPSTTGSQAAEEAYRVLGERWDSLDLAVDGCDCLQCGRRLRRGGATM